MKLSKIISTKLPELSEIVSMNFVDIPNMSLPESLELPEIEYIV